MKKLFLLLTAIVLCSSMTWAEDIPTLAAFSWSNATISSDWTDDISSGNYRWSPSADGSFIYVQAYDRSGGKSSNNYVRLYFITNSGTSYPGNVLGPLPNTTWTVKAPNSTAVNNRAKFNGLTWDSHVCGYAFHSQLSSLMCPYSSFFGDFNGSNITPTTSLNMDVLLRSMKVIMINCTLEWKLQVEI